MNNEIVSTGPLSVTELIGRKALPVYVYKHSDDGMFGNNDATNNGISKDNDELLLLHSDGFIEITTENLHLVVVAKNRPHFPAIAVPVVRNPKDHNDNLKSIGPMFGGNFIYTSDSRFSSISESPVAIHDRWETEAMYNVLSQ